MTQDHRRLVTAVCLLVLQGCCGQCPDMKGEKGEQGLSGFNGAMGVQGPNGDSGVRGMKGLDGLPGMPGQRGMPGRPGPHGEKGDPAPVPIIDPPGPVPGLKGYPGIPGFKGDRGRNGFKGMPGYTGESGMPGLPGVIGEPGSCEDCEESCYPNTRVAFSGHTSGITQSSDATVVSLTNIITNAGGGYQDSSSQFRAPVAGVYTFAITAIANGNGAVPLGLYHNGNKVATTARSSSTIVGPYPLGSSQVNVVMNQDDLVTLKAEPRSGGLIGWVFSQNLSPTDVSFSGYWVSPSTAAPSL